MRWEAELKPLFVRVRAPFAAFRGMQAGVYRGSAPVIPPSAAWGLLLNFAGIETRSPGLPSTLIAPEAPPLRLAIGALGAPEVSTLYQQLHAYPVGASFKNLAEKTRGAKYAIQPIRREILVGLDCIIGVEGSQAVLQRIESGIRGTLEVERYGLPFAGDNNLLIDRVDLMEELPRARWYVPIAKGSGPQRGSCRLTVSIDREDSSRTRMLLCAPTEPTATVPPAAWTWTPRPQAS